MNIIKNYEVIENQKSFAITYSLLDCDCFIHGNNLNLDAKEQQDSFQFSFIQNDIPCAVFENFPTHLMKKIQNKKVLLVGFSEQNEVTTVNPIVSVNLTPKKKFKIGA